MHQSLKFCKKRKFQQENWEAKKASLVFQREDFDVDWCQTSIIAKTFVLSLMEIIHDLWSKSRMFRSNPFWVQNNSNWAIDNTQDWKVREKLHPFYACFTVKAVRFRLAKLIKIWIDIAFCCSCVQIPENPSKIEQFCRKGIFFFSHFSMLGVVYYALLWDEFSTVEFYCS